MSNSTIGKYKITRLIGEGGMASVYEAEHEMLGTKVAIKVLNPILSANAQIKERFRNEAKMMASLDHLNITKVIDFDEQPQQLSIVMEFLNGEDLNQKIKREGPLSEKAIKNLFSQTLAAFEYAHSKGIVHRDIKPSNIFILPNGHVKILDFGIAKLFGQNNEMTQTGTQIGTPIYMSPEQVMADKTIDQRSDIYSLGVTMYYAINGKPPYNSNTDSQFAIFSKIVYEALPDFFIQTYLKYVVLKACHKNREERFQNCGDFLLELNNADPASNPYSDQTQVDTNSSENKAVNKVEKGKETIKTPDSSKNETPNPSNISISPNSLFFHLLPGILLLLIISVDYFIWSDFTVYRMFPETYRFPYFYFWGHGKFLVLSILLLLIGFIVFRSRYASLIPLVYKNQVNRFFYVLPGLLLLIMTCHQYDSLEALVLSYQYYSFETVFLSWNHFPTHILFVDFSFLPVLLSISIILFIVGLCIYFIKKQKEIKLEQSK